VLERERALYDSAVASMAAGVAVVRLYQASMGIGLRYGQGILVSRLPDSSAIFLLSLSLSMTTTTV